MKNRKILYYFLAVFAIGFLIYNYFSTDLGYGMMNHHYGYFNYYSRSVDIFNTGLVFLAYVILILSAILILKEKVTVSNASLEILDKRLSKGEISIEEYRTLTKLLEDRR